MSRAVALKDRRFAVRFLGRPGAWLWLALTLGPGIAAWVLATAAARGIPAHERSWFLWSGNVVLALFVLTLLFVLRKWSVKLAWFRDLGRTPKGAGDAAWAEVQALNRRVRQNAFSSDREILAAADEILVRLQVNGAQRAEIDETSVGGVRVKHVVLRKREPLGRLEPWLEMHMGVGVAACVGVWFHGDGLPKHAVGWMLFAGTAVVLLTGVLGALLYRTLPAKLAAAGPEIPFEEAGVAREHYEASLSAMLESFEPAVRAEIAPALRGADSPAALRSAVDAALGRVAVAHPAQIEAARDLVVMAGTRDHLNWNTRDARRLDFHLKLWRWIHVPVSVFLLFVILIHVWMVLWY